jgi:penicillin-binding protein 1A
LPPPTPSGTDLDDDLDRVPGRPAAPRPLDRDHPAAVAVRQVLAALVAAASTISDRFTGEAGRRKRARLVDAVRVVAGACADAAEELVVRAGRWHDRHSPTRAARQTDGPIDRLAWRPAPPTSRRHAADVVRALRLPASLPSLPSLAGLAGLRRRLHREPPITDGPLRPGSVLLNGGAAVGIVALLTAVLVVGGGASVRTLATSTATAGHPDAVALPALAERTELFAADGSSLGVTFGDDGNRVIVPHAAVPKVVVDAVLDTEDADFFAHDGIDVASVARAARSNVEAGAIAQGGSTITQQLAKSTLDDHNRNLHRKLSEAVLALRIDDQLSKAQILERYLNTIYFGQGAYGIATAAETYFGKPLDQVTLDQAALLAGMIRGPSLYDPVRRPEAALARRAHVLDRMVIEGDLTRAEADAAAAAPLPGAYTRPTAAAGFVADAAKAELLADPRLGETPEARAAAVAGGGLRVHTTVDPAVQQLAQDSVAAGIPRGTKLTAALASIDPTTGAVRALVGGPDYAARQFNAAIAGAGRQTGSSFKVFTLVAALRAGHVSTEPVDGNEPCPIPNPGGKPNPWTPGNYEGEAFGTLTLTDATVHSSNCAFARLASTIGAKDVARTAHEMGITAPLQEVPSMTLGTNTVPPIQMAAAYATLANDGVAHTPHIVERVERRDGTLVFANDGAARRVLDEQTARVATSVLTQVVARGTGRAAALPDGRPVAGKTGTAQNHQDAWFVGYTPQLATAVWMGDIEGEKPMLNVGGINVTGGSYPARLWQRFMASFHAGQPVAVFPAPGPEAAPSVTVPPAPAPSPGAAAGGGGGGADRKGKGRKGH